MNRLSIKASKKGQAILPAIITVAAAIIVLVMVGVIIAYFTGSVDKSNFTATAITNYDAVVSNGWTALKLTAILLFVVVMAVALAVLTGVAAMGR